MNIQFSSHIKPLFLSLFLTGILSLSLYSQETGSCAEKLKNAQTLFERGQVEQVPQILTDCMKSGFNREESLAAYKLLIQACLFDDKLEMADSIMLEFLKENPEYQVSSTDHSSFVNLFNDYLVKPLVQVAIHLGTSLPFITFIDQMTVSSESESSVYRSEAASLFASIEAKFAIGKRLEINIEPGYSQLIFTNIKSFLQYKEVTYTETQRRLELPVSATYNFAKFGKFTPYGRLGAGPALLMGSTAKTVSNPTDINSTDRRTGPDIDRKSSRILMDIFFQPGIGMKFKTPGGFISAEIRSDLGILNQTIHGNESDGEFPFNYSYIDDDFHTNSITFCVGFTQLFYKPLKRND